MEPFCSNVLTNTQCNGLTRGSLIAILIMGLCHGIIGIGLGGYLWRIKYPCSMGWLSALEGMIFSLTVVMEGANRFNPGDLDTFVALEKFTTTLGVLSSILFFGSLLSASRALTPPIIPLTPPLFRRLCLMTIPALFVLGLASLALAILAFNEVHYEVSGTEIRVGSYNQAALQAFSTDSVLVLICFLLFVGITNSIFYRLSIDFDSISANPADVGPNNSKIAGHAKNLVDIQTSAFRRHHILWLQSAILVSISHSLLGLLKVNTIVARRAIGLCAYCAYVLVVIQWNPKRTEDGEKQSQFFTTLPDNSEFSLHEGYDKCSDEPNRLRSNTNDSSAIRGSSTTRSRIEKPQAAYYMSSEEPAWASNLSYNKTIHDRRFRSLSTGTSKSFSTLLPADSASTAAFLPRPPPAPIHFRERATHGRNGSVVIPLREEILLRNQRR